MKEPVSTKSKIRSIKPLAKNTLFSLIILVVAICCYFVSTFFFADNRIHEHHGITIESIRELSTLRCRYHNVAIEQVEGGFLGIGYKEIWIEYDTWVTIGIDLTQAYIAEEVNENGEIEIYLPNANVISYEPDKSSITKVVCDSDIFTSITAEDEFAIVQAADAALMQDIPMKTYILQEAHENAKKIMQAHLDNVNKLLGTNYTIKWLQYHPSGTSNMSNAVTESVQ